MEGVVGRPVSQDAAPTPIPGAECHPPGSDVGIQRPRMPFPITTLQGSLSRSFLEGNLVNKKQKQKQKTVLTC